MKTFEPGMGSGLLLLCKVGACLMLVLDVSLGSAGTVGRSNSVAIFSSSSLGNWDSVTQLANLDGAQFREIATLLVEMCNNAYRYPEVVPVQGWSLVDAIAPSQGGMHGVVYEEFPKTGRMVLAIRGTDLTGSVASDADRCANEMWGADVGLPSNVNCSQFSAATLDYYGQSVRFTNKVLEAYPEASLLLTGHSLGAGLAVLTSAGIPSPVLPVVVFSSAGAAKALEERNLDLAVDKEHKLFVIADEWDEIMRKSWSLQVGTLCLYPATLSENCRLCFEMKVTAKAVRKDGKDLSVESENADSKVSASECRLCFLETHDLPHVIKIIALGKRPVCEHHSYHESVNLKVE